MSGVTFEEALKNLTTLRTSFAQAVSEGRVNLEMESFIAEFNEIRGRVDLSLDETLDSIQSDYEGFINPCNTSCCLVGYGVISGEESLSALDGEDWNEYNDRLFINDEIYGYGSDHIFKFIFGSHHVNNTDAALERLDTAIEVMTDILHHNEPDQWEVFAKCCDDFNKQISGRCFYKGHYTYE